MATILQFMADGSAGGGATVLLGLVEGLADQHDLHVLVEGGSYVAERARILGATVHEGSFFGSPLNPEPARRVAEVFRDVKPDLAHLHGGRALFHARQVRDTRMIYTVHGYHFMHRSGFSRIFGGIAERWVVPCVREVVFVCDYDRNLGLKHGLVPKGMPTRVIYNGVSLPPAASGEADLKQIAFLNRLVPQKDPLLAVETMRLLASEGYRMTMIGGGDLQPEVEAAARDLAGAVTVLGQVSREVAIETVARSGAMLMTSRWEGLPLAPLEAMALGTPVVAPAVSGIPEIITDGSEGRLVASREPRDFAEAVRQVTTSGPKRDAMIVAARAKVHRVFAWETCLSGYRDAYSCAMRS